jgi:LPXTG-motif cell wall-anchored protein
MATNIEAEMREAERRFEQAKESLMARAEELGRRFKEMTEKLDLDGHIAAHPLPAVGIAFMLGAMLGFRRKRKQEHEEEEVERTLGGAVVGAITALGLRLLKDAALKRAAGVAKTWIDKRRGNVPQPTEHATAQPSSTDPFLGY